METPRVKRIFNFSSGPAVMPLPVLEQAREEMLSIGGTGMSLMEMSHRSTFFSDVIAGTEHKLRELLNAPENYKILFLQGGAALQFSMVPMNFLGSGRSADYVVTGAWGVKAESEAAKI